jgi:sarcosine dehydrogenase
MKNIPQHARVVIVGGGIVGCSTAYHLAKLGWKDIVLLERHQLTSGSTFHAAGLVGQLRSQAGITQLLGHSIELYDRLEAETGLATGWKKNGGLRLACTEQRMIELKRQATTAHSFGLEMDILTPTEAQQLWPMMDISDLVGAAFLPTDGQANPSDITMSLAKGARQAGVKVFEQVEVLDVMKNNGRASAVIHDQGQIQCDVVVNCCGQWAREFGRLAGVNIPLVSMQHQYLVTEKIDGITPDLPTLRDPDRLTYYKEDVGGLVMGGYEANPINWAENGFPENFNFTLLDSNWDHFEQLLELAMPRVPALESAGVRELINGPESFTPDGNFILGEAPELNGYFIAAGFNAFGIAAGGGAGKALAEWIVGGEPPYDLWAVDIRRFGAPHQDINWVRTRTEEMYSKHYTMAWPLEEHDSARPVRRSPLYSVLKKQGACFGEKLGWERPNWFAPNGVKAQDEYSFSRQNWFKHVGTEHYATRNSVALFDQTSFAKFLLTGKDALTALNWICSNDIDRPVGILIYTQMLNKRGGIECDLTIARIAEDRFYIVTGTAYATHDFQWIKANIPSGLNADLIDITSSKTVLSLMGPNSRKVLERVTDDDVSNESFPFATTKYLCISGTVVRALRVTYVGELGWELHIPIESALNVYEALKKAGTEFNIVDAGYRAIESLRLEKGYRAWSSDLTPDTSPLEAGMAWAVKLKSDIDFYGRAALEQQQADGLKKMFASFSIDDPNIILFGRETIYRDQQRVGWLSSGGYGYTVEKNIGFGYVRNQQGVTRDYLIEGSYSLEVAAQRVPCKIHLSPLYDPQMKKIRC